MGSEADSEADSEAACPVNHDQLIVKRTGSDGGDRWQMCPQCDVQIEPKHATGIIDVKSTRGRTKGGRGRGPLSRRDTARLGFIAYLAKKGVLKS